MIEYATYLVFLVIALFFTYRTASIKAYKFGFKRGGVIVAQQLIQGLVDDNKLTIEEAYAIVRIMEAKK